MALSRWLSPARRRVTVVVALCAAMLGLVPLSTLPPAQAEFQSAQTDSQGSYLSVNVTQTNSRFHEYVEGDVIYLDYLVTNTSNEVVSVADVSGNVAELEACRFEYLDPTAVRDYNCSLRSYALTQADIDAGSFTPQTTWTVRAGGYGGAHLETLEVNGPMIRLTPVGLEVLDRSGWTVEASSTAPDESAAAAIDGKPGTRWLSANTEPPHTLTIDMGTVQRINGLRYTPWAPNNNWNPDNIKDYQIHVSADKENWERVAGGTFQRGPATTLATFDSTTTRYVRLQADTTHGLAYHAGIAEIDLIRDLISVSAELVNPSPDHRYVPGDVLRYTYRVTNLWDRTIAVSPASGNLEDFSRPGTRNCGHQNLAPGAVNTCTFAYHVVTEADLGAGTFSPQTEWTIREGGDFTGTRKGVVDHDGPAVELRLPDDLIPQSQLGIEDQSSQNTAWEYQVAKNAIDGDPMTMWHNHWNTAGQKHYITLDLGALHQVHTLRYLPRQTGNTNGVFKDFSVYVSADGQTWGDPVATRAVQETRDLHVVSLDPKVGQYLKIVVDDSYGDAGPSASAAELNVQGKLVGIEITKQAWDLHGAPPPADAAGLPGDRAEIGTGSVLDLGTAVTWVYQVKNTGRTELTGVTVTDTYTTAGGNEGSVQVLCPQDTLAAGTSMTCVGSSVLGTDLFARYALPESTAGSTP